MGLNTTKEPAAACSGSLGNCDQAAKQINARVNITPIHDRQTHWIADRFHVQPILAATIATLAFGGSVR